MDKSHCNKAIRCTVNQCASHSAGAEYCALDSITVGTHEAIRRLTSVPIVRNCAKLYIVIPEQNLLHINPICK